MDDDDWVCDKEVINRLQKKYEDEEFPLFMDSITDRIDGNIHLEALQTILYDEHTPEERAHSFKEQGNMHFQDAMKGGLGKNQLRKAAMCYSEGINQQCSDKQLNSLLFSNRAYIHLFLKEYLECIKDCREAIKLDPENIKRASKASLYLNLFNESEMFCTEGLMRDPQNKFLLKLLDDLQEKKKMREEKKKAHKEFVLSQQKKYEDRLEQALADRGLVVSSESHYDLPLDTPNVVSLDKQGNVHWTCIILIPQYSISEVIVDFEENSCWNDHLPIMFPDSGPYAFWDTEREYVYNHLAVYYENDSKKNKLCRVPLNVSLKTILSTFIVIPKNPVFLIVVDRSPFHEKLGSIYEIIPQTFFGAEE